MSIGELQHDATVRVAHGRGVRQRFDTTRTFLARVTVTGDASNRVSPEQQGNSPARTLREHRIVGHFIGHRYLPILLSFASRSLAALADGGAQAPRQMTAYVRRR